MKKRKRKLFTVGDLRKLIEKIPDSVPCGIVGHYGELCEIDESNFTVQKAYIVPENKTWRNANWDDKIDVLNIEMPDIGPDPD